MNCLELNPPNDFSKWEDKYIKELKSLDFKESLGNILVFEDETIKLWNLKLHKGERMPFVKHNKDYSWVSETDAILKTRCGSGRILLLKVEEGDTMYFENSQKNPINDLENLGDDTAAFKIVEFKEILNTQKEFMLN